MMFRVILAVVLLTPISPAAAQITSATLSGTVKDQTGGVLPGVDVVIKNLDTGLSRTVVTDANGYFTVPGLAPGGRARECRDSTAVQTGIVLEVAQQAGLNIILKLSTPSKSPFRVRALVDLRTSALSAVVDEDDQLP